MLVKNNKECSFLAQSPPHMRGKPGNTQLNEHTHTAYVRYKLNIISKINNIKLKTYMYLVSTPESDVLEERSGFSNQKMRIVFVCVFGCDMK